jgi:hypothetical protein
MSLTSWGPSKNVLQRFSGMLPEEKPRPLIHQLIADAALAPEKNGLKTALDLDTYFLDFTCMKTNIQYPVVQEGPEKSDCISRGFHVPDAPTLHSDDTHATKSRWQKAAQSRAAADEMYRKR